MPFIFNSSISTGFVDLKTLITWLDTIGTTFTTNFVHDAIALLKKMQVNFNMQ